MRSVPCIDRVSERLSRLRKLPLILVQFAQLFIICRRRIIQDLRFHHLDARPSPKSLKESAKKYEIWQYFRNDIYTCAEEAAKKNNIKPIVLRPPAHEMHDGENLHKK